MWLKWYIRVYHGEEEWMNGEGERVEDEDEGMGKRYGRRTQRQNK